MRAEIVARRYPEPPLGLADIFFGQLKVYWRDLTVPLERTIWTCRCSCGRYAYATREQLLTGTRIICGPSHDTPVDVRLLKPRTLRGLNDQIARKKMPR